MKKDKSIENIAKQIGQLRKQQESEENTDRWLIIQDAINQLELRKKAKQDRQDNNLKKRTMGVSMVSYASNKFHKNLKF